VKKFDRCIYPYSAPRFIHELDIIEITRSAAACRHNERIMAFGNYMQRIFFKQSEIFLSFLGKYLADRLPFIGFDLLIKIKKR
jgi:hypothetical protein